MSDPQLLRDIGRMEEAVENLVDEVKGLREEVGELKSRLDKLDGGRAALLGLLAAAATIGGLISLVFQNLWGK